MSDDDREVSVGAANPPPTKTFKRSPKQRQGDRMRKANQLIEQAKTLQKDDRKCNGRAKLRDENGNIRRDAEGKALTRPCAAAPIRGGTVCVKHGGNAKHVKAKAQRRLLALVEPTLIRLETLLHQDEHLPTSLGAAKEILNRAGGAAVGPVDPSAGKADTRPIINLGIKVGGIDTPNVAGVVKVGLIPGAAGIEGEVIEDDE